MRHPAVGRDHRSSGGALAAQNRLPFAGVVVVIILGNVIRSFIAYGLAKRYGRRLVLGPGRYIGLAEAHLALADHFFARFGAWAVLIGRVRPVICGYISFPAGLARMRWVPFGVMTLVGSALWATFLTVVGYQLGRHWTRFANALGPSRCPSSWSSSCCSSSPTC